MPKGPNSRKSNQRATPLLRRNSCGFSGFPRYHDPVSETPSSQADSKSHRWKPKTGLTLLGLLLLFTYMPLSRAYNQGPIYTRLSGGDWSVHNRDLRDWRGLRVQLASGDTEVTPGTSQAIFDPSGNSPCRRIWIICRTPGQAVHALGDKLTQRLLQRSSLVEVAFFPARQLPINEYRPPDLWVCLDELQSDSLTLPGLFRASGTVEIRIGPTVLPLPEEYGQVPKQVQQFAYSTQRVGLLSAAGRWDQVGEGLAQNAGLESFLDELENQEPNPLPALDISLFHGPIRYPEGKTFLGLGPELQMISQGNHWMVHDSTGWTLPSRGNIATRAANLAQALGAEGWSVLRDEPGSLTLQNDERLLDMRPLHSLPGASSFLPEWKENDSRPLGIFHYHPFLPESCARYLENQIGHELQPLELKSLLRHLGPNRRAQLLLYLEDHPAPADSKEAEAERIILEQLRA